jgi:hypothetical protein
MATAPAQQPNLFEVDLPSGGKLVLHTQDEVDMWQQASQKYTAEYRLTKPNDLVLLGAILTQNLALFRAQQEINGMEPEFDASHVPTGRYVKIQNQKSADRSAAQRLTIEASKEIRELEKALGIDKKTRESGGAHNVADYVTKLKKAGHQFGVHISKRMKFYEATMMEARWKIRLLRNGDPEDLKEHDLTPETLIDWLEKQLEEAEEMDKKFAAEKGRIFAGKL